MNGSDSFAFYWAFVVWGSNGPSKLKSLSLAAGGKKEEKKKKSHLSILSVMSLNFFAESDGRFVLSIFRGR